MSGKPSILSLSRDNLVEWLAGNKQASWRADQILEWIYKKRVLTFEAMSNVPSTLRRHLSDCYQILPCERVLAKRSGDVTDKLLLRLDDGALIETVIIRAPQPGVGVEGARKTVCISTQVGCAYGCRFCASGLAGWKRDLRADEIIAQLLEVCRSEDEGSRKAESGMASFDNIVVMGMGEPLANYDALMHALRTVNADWGLRFGARRITVSTSGLVPQILRLADEPIGFRLAISLHGATNVVREQIMPINRKYPLEKLLPAARAFSERHGRMLTLEFIMIEDVNDSLEQAHALANIALGLHAHVNLIPYNTVDGLSWRRPELQQRQRFANVLRQAGVSVTLRREKGHDIDAACGQLRLKEMS